MTFPEIDLARKEEETLILIQCVKYVLLNYTLRQFGRWDGLVQTCPCPGDGDLVGVRWGSGMRRGLFSLLW